MDSSFSLRLLVEPVWSPVVIALVIAALLALVWWGYRPRVAHLEPWRRRLLLGLRFVLVAIVLIILLRPEVHYTDSDASRARILILGDSSRSMTVADLPGGLTRREGVSRALAKNAEPLEELQEKSQVGYFNFAAQAVPANPKFKEITTDAPGEQTAIGQVLKQFLDAPSFDDVAAVLLLSDGARRTVDPINPRQIARRYGRLGKPIYTVPFGGNRALATFDLSVDELFVSQIVYERKTVPISAQVRAVGAAGREVVVRVLLEDRTGLNIGETGPMKPVPSSDGAVSVKRITIHDNEAVVPVKLSFLAPPPGEYKVAIEVEPVKGEVKVTNNRRTTIINVRKGGLRVALIASPLAEQKFIRRVNTAQKVQLDFQPVFGGRAAAGPAIPDSWFEPGRYDAYIIGDVQAAAFGPETLEKLAARLDEGAGLLMFGGVRSFGPGGWARTPIADYLPVELRPAPGGPADALNPQYHVSEELMMLPTRAGLAHYVMQLGSNNMAIWRSLPPLQGANRLRPKVGGLVEVLAQSESEVPLLVAHVVGTARIMAFAGDTTYLWYLSGHQQAHQRFWRQVVLWLTHSEEAGEQPVWALAEPRNLAPGQSVTLTYGAQNDAGQPIEEAQFAMQVFGPDGQKTQVAAPGGAVRNVVAFTQTNQPGDYWVRVSATVDGKSVGLPGSTRFLIEDRDLELDNPAADPALLNDLAQLSGGLSVPAEELDQLLEKWVKNPPGDEHFTALRRVPLWDNSILLTIFIGLIALEWFLRKRFGLV